MYRAHDDHIDATFLLHQRLRTLMNRRMGSIKRQVDSKPLKFTYAQYQLLSCIKVHQPCTPGKAASALGFLAGSLTNPIKVLVADNLVKETDDEFDLRKSWLTLTDEGARLLNQAEVIRDKVSLEILGAVDPSYAEGLTQGLLAMSKAALLMLDAKSTT